MIYFDSFVTNRWFSIPSNVLSFVTSEILDPPIPLKDQLEGLEGGFDMLQLITGMSNTNQLLNVIVKYQWYFRQQLGDAKVVYTILCLYKALNRMYHVLAHTNHFEEV